MSGLNPFFYRLYSDPLQLYELYLTYPYITPSHYFVCNNSPITFNSTTYQPLAVKRSAIQCEDGTVINDVEIGLDNVDLAFQNLVAAGFLNQKRVVVKLVFNSALSDPSNYKILVDGYLDQPKGDDYWVSMTVRPYPAFQWDFPRRVFQVGCNYTFCDNDCTLTLTDYQKTTGVVLTGSTAGNILFDNSADTGNLWVPGYILFTSGVNNGFVYPIATSSNTGAVMRVAFPNTPAIGDTFIIQQLCSKSPSACTNFNNYINYGGFPQVPKQPII